MTDVCIRLSEAAFYYSIRRDGVMVETAAVPVHGVEEPDAECEYYGGSEVMD